ncbi:hypothetical protein ACR79N_10355, partial [Sphingobacterium siyangense]|uniref:hypothetical protein n=1 Tax=Sphingobacterium siyangense TaxID=459529 RepID=UPI003DA45D05
SFQERLPWSKGYNILPVQSDEIVCLKMITPQTFGMIRRYSRRCLTGCRLQRYSRINKKA